MSYVGLPRRDFGPFRPYCRKNPRRLVRFRERITGQKFFDLAPADHWTCVKSTLLVGLHPALNISFWINLLKSAPARRMRHRFANHLAQFYGKPSFGHRAYDVGRVGGASLETVKRFVDTQGTKEKPRKAAKKPPPA